MNRRTIVITTINGITNPVEEFSAVKAWTLVLVGDQKTPPIERDRLGRITFLSVKEQIDLGFRMHDVLPFNHYSRKNLGYLVAVRDGSTVIADTDDDNYPYPSWPHLPNATLTSIDTIVEPKVPNVYALFTEDSVWPRGFPLEFIRQSQEIQTELREASRILVWQGLADEEPDVDAIYRLTVAARVRFKERPPVALDGGVYSPFNSQNTIWLPEAYPFLYLPATVSMRFTDILRSYVAQRGLHAIGARVAFTSPSVRQFRNTHDLMADFEQEIQSYVHAMLAIEVLDRLQLHAEPTRDLVAMYEGLCDAGIVRRDEINAVRAWVADLYDAGWVKSKGNK